MKKAHMIPHREWSAAKTLKDTEALRRAYTVEASAAEMSAQRASALEIGPDSYKRLRAAEYPPIGDQLDAILKGFNQLRLQGTDLPADLDGIVNDWLAVKKKHPKPESSE